MLKKMNLGLLILSLQMLVLFSFSMTTSAQSAQTKWWKKFGEPKYGGTITQRTASLSANFDNTTWFFNDWNYFWDVMFVRVNWTQDRNEWGFKVDFTPEQYCSGQLAESWEMPDQQTVIIKIRQGVHFQDKPPVNGRELTADDLQKHYDRILGTGGGYTAPLPTYSMFTGNWDKVTATDKYTILYKFKKPSAFNLLSIMEPTSLNAIEPPEWVALGGPPKNEPTHPPGPPEGGDNGKEGDAKDKGGPPPVSKGVPLSDWRNAVGSGPWILTDYKDSSFMTFIRNPNYWGHDERYPQNQVPYADTLKMTNIPDASTAIAGLRTGKIDLMTDLDWRQKLNLGKTNPDLLFEEIPSKGNALQYRCDTKPFSDIRVRKALEMAIDRPVIAKSLFGGTVEGTPVGMIHPALKGYAFKYKDWPQELKDEYTYNPERAKKLLAEAGYPNGFKTNIVYGTIIRSEVIEAIKAYLLDIGVDMEIRPMEWAQYADFVMTGKHDQMCLQETAYQTPPNRTIQLFDSKSPENSAFVKDPEYDDLVHKFWAAPNQTEVTGITREMDRMYIEKHWQLDTFATVTYTGWQPWLHGFSGEMQFTWGGAYIWARLWVDENKK